jgi:hypothetical protein
MAAPELAPSGTHSGGTAIWHVPLLSLMVFHPAGMVCADAAESNKRTRAKTKYALMAGSVAPAAAEDKANRPYTDSV